MTPALGCALRHAARMRRSDAGDGFESSRLKGKSNVHIN
jgi:hypothetical protein